MLFGGVRVLDSFIVWCCLMAVILFEVLIDYCCLVLIDDRDVFWHVVDIFARTICLAESNGSVVPVLRTYLVLFRCSGLFSCVCPMSYEVLKSPKLRVQLSRVSTTVLNLFIHCCSFDSVTFCTFCCPWLRKCLKVSRSSCRRASIWSSRGSRMKKCFVLTLTR